MSETLHSAPTALPQLRGAVVGVGYLGRFHAQKYTQLARAQLIGVCDRDLERAQTVAQELGCEAFSHPADLIGRIDCVTIAAATLAHYELGKFFLQNGVHVHVEKPMTNLISEAEELVALANKNNLVLQVGHVERFNPALRAAREKLERPLFIECHRLAPFKPRGADVSVVLDLMIHDLDVILSLVDSQVTAVSAVGTPVMTKSIDIANARLEFASGTVANVTASRVSLQSVRKFRVFQANQYLSIDFGSGELNLLTKTGEWDGQGEPPISAEEWSLEKGDALLAETEAFLAAIANHSRPIVSGEDGLVALKLAHRIMADIERRLP